MFYITYNFHMQADQSQFQIQIPLGPRFEARYPIRFRKGVELQDIHSNTKFSYKFLIDFLIRLPNYQFFICLHAQTKGPSSNFHTYCNNCQLKIFKIIIKFDCILIKVLSLCEHFQIHILEKENSKFGIFLFISKTIDMPTINNLSFHSSHPFRVIGKYIYNLKNCDIVLKRFLHPLVFSEKSISRHQQIFDNSDSFDSLINNKSGYFMIGFFNSHVPIKNLLIFEGRQVQYLVWIAPWCHAFLSYFSGYFQIDASFKALAPYTYSVPTMVINNASIPLGIVLGPSESFHLFDLFYNFNQSILPSIDFKKFPILSDEGLAIQSFANHYELIHFFCFRHLIEKVGSNSILGEITRRLLFQPSIEGYKNALKQALEDIHQYLLANIVQISQVRKFQKIFLMIMFGYNLIPLTYDHKNGIWNRAFYGVSTCSNHIERLHRTLNQKTSNIKKIHLRFNIVISELFNYYNTFEERSRDQANYSLNKFRKYSQKHCCSVQNICPHNCGWGLIYSYRFGISNFPCKHTALSFKDELIPLSKPIVPFEIHEPVENNEIPNWKFPVKTYCKNDENDFSLNIEEQDEDVNEDEEYSFLSQTAKEILATGKLNLSYKEILCNISKLWGIEVANARHKDTKNILFRSKFKCKLHESVLNH